MNIELYWKTINDQNWDELKKFFDSDVKIKWWNTNELFNIDEFITINKQYPGNWKMKVKRTQTIDNVITTITYVYEEVSKMSFHVTSFFEIYKNRIINLDEYWSENGSSPVWRQDMKIGIPIE